MNNFIIYNKIVRLTWIISKGYCELLGWVYGFLIETNYLKSKKFERYPQN